MVKHVCINNINHNICWLLYLLLEVGDNRGYSQFMEATNFFDVIYYIKNQNQKSFLIFYIVHRLYPHSRIRHFEWQKVMNFCFSHNPIMYI